MLRPTALVPALCCLTAFILSFLCLFAGHKRNFMEDYHLLTLNTSRIGYNLIQDSSVPDIPGSNSLTNLFNDFAEDIGDSVTSEINEFVGDTAQRLGIEDFYSVHLLDYCSGDYTPAPLPNSTLKSSAIHKNVTDCTDMRANFHFDPTDIIENALNKSGVDVTLDDLQWPQEIQDGLNALHILQTTTFALYCIAIVFLFVAMIGAFAAVFVAGRLSACVNVLITVLAFLAIGLASALVTAVAVKGTNVINEHGERIGLEAKRGVKFLALTWATTALVFIAMVWWLGEVCVGRRKVRGTRGPKYG